MSFGALLGVAGLSLSLAMILWLCWLFAGLGNSRFAHFRMFFGIQAVVYACAVIGNLLGIGGLLIAARVLTPVSYAYLVWGMRRTEQTNSVKGGR